MWKSKKFIIILTLVIVALIGGTTGAVLAASTDDGGTIQAETQREALLDRICEIYEENTGVVIDPDQLQSAFNQAQQEMREQALQERLQAMVDSGTITQDDADQIIAWWQAKPDIDLQGIMGFGFEGGMMGGRGLHHWDGVPYCGDTSGDAASDSSDATADGTTA